MYDKLTNHSWRGIISSEVINMPGKVWTDSDVDQLLEDGKTKSASYLAQEFGVTCQAVIDKLRKLGTSLKELHGETWTESDTELLRQHFEYAPKEYIARLFPQRSWNGILQRGNKVLKLKRIAQDRVYVNYKFFDEWTPDSAYVFGFILADGWIGYGRTTSGNKSIIQIEVHVKDTNVLHRIAASMDFQGSFTYQRRAVKFSVHNPYMTQRLIEKGMPYEDKSHTATFPVNVPDSCLRHLIRGLIDGDGYSTYDGNTYKIGLCGTYDIVSHVHNLVPVDLSTIKIQQSTSNCYYFNVQGQKAFKIAEWLYEDCTIWLTRKRQAYIEAKTKYLSKAPSSE